MRITEQQESFLKNLVCQRLREDEMNRQYIKGFRCNRNSGLSSELRDYAWKNDENGAAAYYIIKTRDNKVLLYFSLQCGSVFDPIDEKELAARLVEYRDLLDRVNTVRSSSARGRNMAQLQQLERTYQMSVDDLHRQLESVVGEKKSLMSILKVDAKLDNNPLLSRVYRTYPAVELLHFVANDNAKSIWRKSGIPHGMGEVLFWYFVSPVITDIYRSMGCQYAYLYAADPTDDMLLINHYDVRFNFQRDNKLGASKPYYDYKCTFMCQHVDDMRAFREEYFDSFNPDPDDILI